MPSPRARRAPYGRTAKQGRGALGAGGGGVRDGRLRAHGSPRRPALVAHAVGQRQPHARNGRCQGLILHRTLTVSTCDGPSSSQWGDERRHKRACMRLTPSSRATRASARYLSHTCTPRAGPSHAPLMADRSGSTQHAVSHAPGSCYAPQRERRGSASPAPCSDCRCACARHAPSVKACEAAQPK